MVKDFGDQIKSLEERIHGVCKLLKASDASRGHEDYESFDGGLTSIA